jgi:UDP-GlcNAc:undecaprenyl-phosphate/decaprenyl-phosphate GlcNAc-1-phosphate transferase
MSIYYLVLIVVTALISIICIFLSSIAARRLNFLSSINGVPPVGGISIGVVFSIFFVISSKLPVPYSGNKAFILAAFLILASGLWDDIRELSVAGKICAQFVACGLLVWSGVRTHIVFLNGIGNIIVTVIWVLAVTNAFNLLDIMDGLCAGITLVVAGGLFTICAINGNVQVALLLSVFIGAVAGFLMFNMPPAKVYLGNAGSHFLGFMLAVISISVHYASSDRQVALLSPVLIMGFPIFDTLFVSMMRLKNGKSAIRKSKDHLALRFIKLGHSQLTALFYMVVSALFFACSGIIVSRTTNFAGSVIVAIVLVYFCALTIKMKKVLVDG